MKYFAALGIALLVIAAASVGPWAPSPFTSQTGTNTTAAAWRTALGAAASSTLSGYVTNNTGSATNLSVVGLTVTGQTNTDLTASRMIVTDSNKKLASSSATATEAGYLSGVTSAIQTQLDGKPTVALTNVARLDQSQTFTGLTNRFGKVGVGGAAGAEVLKVTGNSETTGWIDAASIRVDGSTVFDTVALRLDVGSVGGFTSVTLGKNDAIVQIGGSTADYPGLKRNGTRVQSMLATGAAGGGFMSALYEMTDNGGNPSPAADGAFVFAKDVAGTVEVFVMDEAGNVTQISPHARASSPAPKQLDSGDKTPIVIHHANVFTGEQEWLHLSAMAKEVEKLSGKKFVFRTRIPDAEVRDWNAEQARLEAMSETEVSSDRASLNAWQENNRSEKGERPTVRAKFKPKPKPAFLQ